MLPRPKRLHELNITHCSDIAKTLGTRLQTPSHIGQNNKLYRGLSAFQPPPPANNASQNSIHCYEAKYRKSILSTPARSFRYHPPARGFGARADTGMAGPFQSTHLRGGLERRSATRRTRQRYPDLFRPERANLGRHAIAHAMPLFPGSSTVFLLSAALGSAAATGAGSDYPGASRSYAGLRLRRGAHPCGGIDQP